MDEFLQRFANKIGLDKWDITIKVTDDIAESCNIKWIKPYVAQINIMSEKKYKAGGLKRYSYNYLLIYALLQLKFRGIEKELGDIPCAKDEFLLILFSVAEAINDLRIELQKGEE